METSPNSTTANGQFAWKIFRGASEIEGTGLHGKTLLDNVFVRNLQLDAGANLDMSIDKAGASLGIIGVNITGAKGSGRIGGSLAIQDPGPVFDGRVTLKEATGAIATVATKLTAQRDLTFPITPSGTLPVKIQGTDTTMRIGVGQVADVAALVAKLNADTNSLHLQQPQPAQALRRVKSLSR